MGEYLHNVTAEIDAAQGFRGWAALEVLYRLRHTLGNGRPASKDLLDNLSECLHELTLTVGLFYLQQKVIRVAGIDGAQAKMDALLEHIAKVDIRKLQRWLDSNS
jgi:hypothetical protein